jgi:putative DNA primase/helicase
LERPETKVYDGDPLALIQANRGKYLAAIFNIVRAFLASGEQVAVEPLNGFGPWARFVQQPLVWLGCADPVASQSDARARDPVFTALRQRVAAIKKHFHHSESFTASDVYNKIMADLSTGRPRPEHQDLFDAFSRDGRPLTVASIGRRLSGDEDDVVDGFSIQVVRDWSGESKKYCVMPRPTAPAAEEPF